MTPEDERKRIAAERKADYRKRKKAEALANPASIVAETYLPNPRKLPHVRHVNGRLHDNSANNLEWCE